MEEDIKNLSEIIELCEAEINNNDENVTAILDLTDLKSLRNLITRNRGLEALKNSCPAIPTTGIECDLKKQLKVLEQENKILENEHNTIFQKWKSIIEEKDYIPKSKIKEKIEELKNEDLEIYDTDSEDLIIAKYEQRAILDFLEELLQEGE